MPAWLPPLVAATITVLLLNAAWFAQRMRRRAEEWPRRFARELRRWDGRVPNELRRRY